jgi:undecaprenyl-diphosphatase
MDEFAGYLFVFVYGILQGLTGILPISGSGHLAIIGLMKLSPPINLTVVFILQTGSLIAIVVWFHNDLRLLEKQLRSSMTVLRREKSISKFTAYQKVPYKMLFSLFFTLTIGWSLQGGAEFFLANSPLVSIMLLLNGLILSGTAWYSRGALTLDELGWKDYLLLGFVQGMAIIPGISRLGIVICVGLCRGLGWNEALRLSFLLSIPTIAGGIVIQLQGNGGITSLPWAIPHILLGLAVSAVVSLLGLQLLYNTFLERRSLLSLGYYCFMLGTFSFVYLLSGYQN